jgi:hypothetical protein
MSATKSEALSAIQLVANQLNALKSTGPRTKEGKATSRLNARRHGLTGQFFCLSEGDWDAYQLFEANLLSDLKPVGHLESQLAISIVQDEWRLNRSRGTENNVFAQGHDEFAPGIDANTPNVEAALAMAKTSQSRERYLTNIALYETRIGRMIAKNEKRLKELQAERKAAEAAALEEAELLLRYADFTAETTGTPDVDPAAAPGTIEVNGFVFSTATLRLKMAREKRLANAKRCAALGWDHKIIGFERLPDAA